MKLTLEINLEQIYLGTNALVRKSRTTYTLLLSHGDCPGEMQHRVP